ncbi:MAG TPA: peptide-methionine (S)-S-oxide reductase MsrA [Opitutaceae bacterium]|nr:peptide-methionine (S)-S-oxide reductase MsrA [Opitutaceae bacterium]
MSAAPSESIVLGGGCFWCTDAAYQMLPGVVRVTAGYAGGSEPNPTYEQVCEHATGHAEVTRVEFDPARISLGQILDFFWKVHDPTQVGGQGNDQGPQYRSIILFADPRQEREARAAVTEAQKRFSRPITTEIVPLGTFWPAEGYHQDYFAKHPEAGYCAVVIRPKLAKLRSSLVTKS